ncbi:MAG: carbonic anhydrase, partial [Rhodospirillaceae bacterium]
MMQRSVGRRVFVGSLAAALALPATAAGAQPVSCEALTAEAQAAFTPDQAVEALREGNARFVAGVSKNCDLMAQVKATAGGQAPFAAVVGCIDSRVPPELVFDQKIGDIFAARVAGNFVNTDIIG